MSHPDVRVVWWLPGGVASTFASTTSGLLRAQCCEVVEHVSGIKNESSELRSAVLTRRGSRGGGQPAFSTRTRWGSGVQVRVWVR